MNRSNGLEMVEDIVYGAGRIFVENVSFADWLVRWHYITLIA